MEGSKGPDHRFSSFVIYLLPRMSLDTCVRFSPGSMKNCWALLADTEARLCRRLLWIAEFAAMDHIVSLEFSIELATRNQEYRMKMRIVAPF